MTCTEFLSMLDDMLDDAINPDLREQVREHLRCCDHCEVTLNTTRKTIQIYRSNQIYDMPPGLRERLHAAIMARCKKGC